VNAAGAVTRRAGFGTNWWQQRRTLPLLRTLREASPTKHANRHSVAFTIARALRAETMVTRPRFAEELNVSLVS
jgi:hypothetical protein